MPQSRLYVLCIMKMQMKVKQFKQANINMLIQYHRRRLHGGDGPHGQKVVGGGELGRRPQTILLPQVF